MTKLKFLISCLAILFTTSIGVAANTMVSDAQELRSEIADLFQDLDLDRFTLEEETKIVITFLVNKENKLVVLWTDNQRFDDYFKANLNYRELKFKNSKINQIYTLPVTLKV